MQEYYDLYGLIKKGKCMYCLKELDEDDEEETAEHFIDSCIVIPKRVMKSVDEQWEYVQKQMQAGWFTAKAEGFRPPKLLEDGRPGREEGQKRQKRMVCNKKQ